MLRNPGWMKNLRLLYYEPVDIFGVLVLASFDGHNGREYVTWLKDEAGYSCGHYFETLIAAKRDFVERVKAYKGIDHYTLKEDQ